MNKISSMGIVAAIITALLIFAATNSVFAVPVMPSKQMNQQIMSQLFTGKDVKIGNMTFELKPIVMLGGVVMPLMCTTSIGNLSGLPMLGNMMARNMNQSSMMMGGAQGNQSMNGMGAMTMHKGMVPSMCFSMSDVLLFRSMVAHRGSMSVMMGGGNMTGGSAMMGDGK